MIATMLNTLTLLGQTAAPNVTSGSSSGFNTILMAIGAILLIFVVPLFLGSAIANWWRMPKHATKIGVTIGAIVASVLVLLIGQLRYGVDIRGGTILLYEIDEAESTQPIDPNEPALGTNRSTVAAQDVARALAERINPAGTKEISIRPYGTKQIEIVVPNVDQFEIDEIKRLVSNSGTLQFRIVANSRDHADVIQAARQQSTSTDSNLRVSRDVRNAEGKIIGHWYTVGREPARNDGIQPLRENVLADIARDSFSGQILEFPPLEGEYAVERYLASQNIRDVDVLIALEKAGQAFPIVNGEDLSRAMSTLDQQGAPAISFNMNTGGAQRLLALTAANQPDGNFKRRMAIILDGRVLSAPSLNSPISSNGIIEGRFTKDDVDFMVSILRSGRLPAVLGKEPISQNQIGSILGVDTINKGLTASVASLLATLLMVLVYYRFPGIIACLALLLNTLLVFAIMIAIRQPLTLPGLAGLVLSVGMAVDANVLVFERMREEIAKGSTKRLAVRNGFERAFTTIIDSNLTTLISGIVLYAVGTDQVRGFAVTLTIGILCSMFSAVYVAHLLFDLAERFGFLNLSMSDLVGWLKKKFLGDRDIDFMGARNACLIGSAVLIGIGLVAVFARGRDLLDVDLRGGTSVVFQLDKPAAEDSIRQLTNKIFDKDSNNAPISKTLSRMTAQGMPDGSVYRLDTSLFDENELKQRLVDGFAKEGGPSLVTFRVDSSAGTNGKTSDTSSPALPKPNEAKRAARFVSYNPQEEAPKGDAPAADAPQTEAPKADAATPPAETKPAETPAAETPPAATPAETAAPAAQGEAPAAAAPAAPVVKSDIRLSLKSSAGSQSAKIEVQNLTRKLIDAAKSQGITLVEAQIGLKPTNAPPTWNRESTSGFDSWDVTLSLPSDQATKVIDGLQNQLKNEPVFLSLSEVGPAVADEMQGKAIGAVLISLFFIAAYIWFRFQKIAFGLAAVVALLHDVLITLGIVALSHWLAGPLKFLMIEDFKINLAMVASFLTIIGYSLNDTIVVFDRIREVRGKSPRLTSEMVNLSVNQTLSRTLLTSATTIVSILLLYIFGGEGIHGFAFSLFVGIIVGTFSSIYIASPILLWLVGREEAAKSA
jgi:SecD/SecF fusion protein